MKKPYLLSLFFCLTNFIVTAQEAPDPVAFPIQLKYFEAQKGTQFNLLRWLAPCQSTEATFEVQRSADGKNFNTLETITADQSRCLQPFEYKDYQKEEGTNFYRIRMISIANEIIPSFVVAVLNGNKGYELNALLPSVVQSTAVMNISAAHDDKLMIYVTDISGRRHLVQQEKVFAGNNNVSMDFSVLPKGQYIISALNSDRTSKSLQFLKQ